MLKADFHIHTKEDPQDSFKIQHDARCLIDFASEKGFEVLAITLHNKLFFDKELESFAKKRGILLIPGIELRIGMQEFVILMKKPNHDVEKISNFDALRLFKKKNQKNILIIAAHLFYPRYFWTPKNLVHDMVDAFEYTHFYLRWLNLNKKSIGLAKRLGKPVVGNSDTHGLWQMDHTYSVLDCKKDLDSIFDALRKGNVSVVTEPFFFRTLVFMLNPYNIIRGIFHKMRLKR